MVAWSETVGSSEFIGEVSEYTTPSDTGPPEMCFNLILNCN